MTAQPTQRKEVATVSICRTHADHRHKQRDERGGPHQDQSRYPVNREDGDNNHQRHKHCQRHLWKITRIVIVHIVDLLQDQRRPATGRFALDPRRPGFRKPVEHFAADLIADVLAGMEPNPFAQPDHPRTQDENQHQNDKRQQQRFARDALHDHMIENAGQQPCLGNNQQTADKSQNAGNHKPAAGQNALLFQPAR